MNNALLIILIVLGFFLGQCTNSAKSRPGYFCFANQPHKSHEISSGESYNMICRYGLPVDMPIWKSEKCFGCQQTVMSALGFKNSDWVDNK
jgi:hypothetical protein